MAPRHVSVLAFLFLAACPDVILTPPTHDQRPPRPLLEAGAYEVLVEDVVALSCPGVPRGELVGEVIPADLRVGEEEVVLDLGGWILRGEMAPGSLSLEGGAEGIVYETEDDCVDVDYGEEVDPDGGERPDDGGTDDVDGALTSDEDVSEGEDREPPREDEDCGDEEPRPVETYASLEARILDAEHADGRLELSFEGCEMVLAVVMSRGDGAEPPPEEEEPCGEDRDVAEGAPETDCG